MRQALDSFERNLGQTRQLGGLYRALQSTTTAALDLSDILRAQLVLAVSSFDHFIHELTRLGMLEIYAAQRQETTSFRKFDVSLSALRLAVQNPGQTSWFDQEIRDRLGWQAFQRPEKVAEAVRLISDVELWNGVGRRLRRPAKVVKTQLSVIVDRRNKIAHEADVDPTDSSLKSRWPISERDVTDATEFLAQVGRAVYAIVARSDN